MGNYALRFLMLNSHRAIKSPLVLGLNESSAKTLRIVKDDLATLINGRAVNIEDILNQLRRIRELTSESETRKYLGVCGKDASTIDGEICRAIYKPLSCIKSGGFPGENC